MNNFNFSTVGNISSCFKEKFTIPRQPGLVPAAAAELILRDPYAVPEIVRGLEGFSHVWIIFAFHAIPLGQWKPTVRPPRLGGNQRYGVFATRSTHRPNPIGLSVVSLSDIKVKDGRASLLLDGCDLLDGTPVLDIKPYIPYADSIPQATGGFAGTLPEAQFNVCFTLKAAKSCELASNRLEKDVEELIRQLLALDPRPSYQSGQQGDRIYATHLCDFDLRWRYLADNVVEVVELSIKEE